MNVVHEVNIEAGEEVDAPAQVVDEFDRVLATQYDIMLDEPIVKVEELEATQELNEEKLIEDGKRNSSSME